MFSYENQVNWRKKGLEVTLFPPNFVYVSLLSSDIYCYIEEILG